MKLVKLWEKIGKQPLKSSQSMDVIVQYGDDKLFVTGINYESGNFVSLQAERIWCITCKNNTNGYTIPHTCDICTSLDQEEDYGMWELKR